MFDRWQASGQPQPVLGVLMLPVRQLLGVLDALSLQRVLKVLVVLVVVVRWLRWLHVRGLRGLHVQYEPQLGGQTRDSSERRVYCNGDSAEH